MSTGIYVDRDYEMDPQFEDLLFDGTYLRDGMIVLIEDSMLRGDLERIEEKYARERLNEANRWATVSHVQIQKRFAYNDIGAVVGEESGLLSFIATYADGTKKKRKYDVSFAWIVKIDSIG